MTNERQPTVLLVDDDPSNLNLLVDQLFAHGFRLMVAKSGESALERAGTTPPDIILLDVRMPPGIDGFETCRRLKADPKLQATPVIFLSASTDVDDKASGLRAGGVDYITKPLEIDEVLLRIDTHLTLRRVSRELAESNATLEARVAERTVQLTEEIERRTQSERQQSLLLDVVRSQGSQLQLMTKRLLTLQLHYRSELEQDLNQVAPDLQLVHRHVAAITDKVDNDSLQAELGKVTQLLERIQTAIRKVTDGVKNPRPEETIIEANPLLKLSEREREVLLLLVNDHTTEDIASLLYLTSATVRTYRYRISQKLGVKDEDELLALALKYLV